MQYQVVYLQAPLIDAVLYFWSQAPQTFTDVPCPEGESCPDDTTCCKIYSGGYGCCPYPDV